MKDVTWGFATATKIARLAFGRLAPSSLVVIADHSKEAYFSTLVSD